MDKAYVIAALLGLHALVVLISVPMARRNGRRLGMARILFALLLPVFGAAISVLFATCAEPEEDSRDHLKRNTNRYEGLLDPGIDAAAVVPLEEAFLINSPKKRREMIMNLLRSDPRKHMELLLLSRFNEDPETAHYATATLTEVQRQMQLELQQMQAALAKQPDDAQLYIAYVKLMESYTTSGLLEGRLLERQRRLLEKVLEVIPEGAQTIDMLEIKVCNLLALNQAQEARACAEKMIDIWEEDERSWIAALRVCVESHDQQGLWTLKSRAEAASVAWTHAGLERMRYFSGGSL